MTKAKQFSGQFKKLDETGTATVVFATLETIDKDGDWIPKGAIGTQTAKVVGAHDWKSAPLGIAKITEQGNEAIAEIKFNLEMQTAAEWYQSVKFSHENGADQEYSFGFDVLDSERGQKEGKSVRLLKSLHVHEVSPVMIGAGVNTRTLAVKEAKDELDFDKIETFDDLHNAILAADEDLQAQLKELEAKEDDATKHEKLSDHFTRMLGEVDQFSERLQALAALRAKEGRTLSRATRERLTALMPRLSEAMTDLQSLLAETDAPAEPAIPELGKSFDADALYAEFLQIQSRQMGHLR